MTDAVTLTADAIGWTLSITPEFAATYCAAGCSAWTESFYVEGTEGPEAEDDSSYVESDLGWPSVRSRDSYTLSPTRLAVPAVDNGGPSAIFTHLRPVVVSKRTSAVEWFYGAWTRAREPIPTETPALQITSIDNSYYHVTVGTLALTMWNRTCWNLCSTEIFGYSPGWGTRSLGKFNFTTGKVFHSANYYQYSRLWAVITPVDPAIPTVTTAKVAIPSNSPQGNIINNVDLLAAGALVASRNITPEELCLPLNNLRVPGEGSVTNAFNTCDQTARTAGTAAALRHVASTYGAAAMAIIMAGTYALPVAPTQAPPPQPAPAPVDDPDEPAVWAGSPEHQIQRIADSLRRRANKTRPIPENSIEAVATTCYEMATAGGYAPSVCETHSIFLPGADIFEAARHDARAIHQTPSWFLLTRTTRELPSHWYNAFEPCLLGTYSGPACDEYPFAKATEGGPASSGHPQASLEIINFADNRNEGSKFWGFLSNCRVKGDGGPFLVLPLVAAAESDRALNPSLTVRVCAESSP